MGRTEFAISLKLLDQKFKAGMKGVQNQLSQFKGWVTRAFAATSVMEFVRSFSSIGSGFDKQMAIVRSVTNATKGDLKMMTDEALRLGAATAYSATQAAQALENLVRNGLSAAEATKALEKVLYLASSQAIELSQAADIATTAMNAFGMSADELERINDVLATTASNSATNVLQLGEAMSVAGPVAKVLGVAYEDLVAVLGTLANVGMKGTEAGTQFRIMLTRLSKQTPVSAKALQKYGLSISEADLKAENFSRTLTELASKNMSFEDLAIIFGRQATSSAAALLSNLKDFKELQGKNENSQGATDRMYVQSTDPFTLAIDVLKSTWEAFMIEIFHKGSKVFTAIVNQATELVNILRDFPYLLTAIGLTIGKTIGSIVNNVRTPVEDFAHDTSKILSESVQFSEVAHKFIDNNLVELFESKYSYNFAEGVENLDAYIADLKNELENLPQVFSKEDKGRITKISKAIDNYRKHLEKLKPLMLSLIELRKEVNSKKRDEPVEPLDKTDKAAVQQYKEDLKAFKEYEKLTKKYESTNKKYLAELDKLKGYYTEVASYTTYGKEYYDLGNYQGEGRRAFDWKKLQSEATEVISDFFSKIKSFGSSLLNFFGGWIGVFLTFGPMIYGFYDNWKKKQDKVFNEIKEGYKDIENEIVSMEASALSLAEILSKNERSTSAWKEAMEKLSNAYPLLLDYMKLEEVYVNGSTEAYDKLKDSIKEVIKEQRNLRLERHKQDSIDKLLKDYEEKTSDLRDYLVDIFTVDNRSKEAAEIIVSQLRSDITSLLKSGGTKEDISILLRNRFKDYNITDKAYTTYGGASYYRSDNLANKFLQAFKRYGESIKSIENIKISYDEYDPSKIETIVRTALELSLSKAKELETIEKAKGTDEEGIRSKIASSNKEILDDLVKKLNQISSPVDGKSALEYATGLDEYKALLKSTIFGVEGSGGSSSGGKESKTSKQLFDETKKYIDALKKNGIIDENEYRERLINAYDTYISSLESEQKTGDKDIETLKTLISERDKVKKELEKSKKAEEDFNKATEGFAKVREEASQVDIDKMFEAERISRDLSKTKDNKGRRGSGYIWDKFNFSNKFEKDLIDMDFNFQKLDQYLQDLQSIGGDKFDVLDKIEELSKLGQKSGAQELIKQLQILLDELEKAEKAATDLDNAIQLKKAQKEIKEMQSESSKMIYDTVKNGVQGLDSLANSWVSLFENFSDMNFGEQFSGIVNTVFSTIDTVMSFLESLKQVTEFMELLGLKKEALAAIEQTTSGATIAAIQAEAGAVVAAEAEKTAAITGALATQASANLVAKAAQTSAATTAMAAESTAAYASIPFAGVGLAAAQIAEMQALIAATAALPMFAEGGIVGGSKYYGDQNLARVNSGEMILNRTQQSRLWGIVNGGSRNNSSIGKVEFEITGQKLRGVLKNYDNKMGKLS